MKRESKNLAVLISAVASAMPAVLPVAVSANPVDAPGFTSNGRVYRISTTGATALGAFARANANRGPFLVGDPAGIRIGNSVYTPPPGVFTVGLTFATAQAGSSAGAPEPSLSADRAVYFYHETGSVNGVRELLRAQGMLPTGTTPFTASGTNPLWVMGTAKTSFGGTQNGYTVPALGGYNPVVAYSDVRAVQAFSVPGDAVVNRAPGSAGYGLNGPRSKGNQPATTSFQQLTSVNSLDDRTTPDVYAPGLATLQNRIRDESLAVVPFTISANVGTGLDSISDLDARFLNATGRLANGANFNFVTRDIGSGTRNQGGNNFNVDPSWAAGERDRYALGTTTTQDVNANPVTVNVGQEQNPEFTILGGTGAVNTNEHRPSAIARFADKTSGSVGVRGVVTTSRMALGIVSVGDVGARGRVNGNDPMRVLAIDFDEAPGEAGEPVTGPVQPRAVEVTDGRYQFWSAAQANTVIPVNASGVVVSSTAIKGDFDDVADATAGAQTGPGLHRKWLDNINNSISVNGLGNSNATPFDSIVAAGFIPTSLMLVDKPFDGATQFRKSNAAAIQSSPAYGTFIANSPAVSGTLAASLNWVRAGDHNGNATGQFYNVYDVSNNPNATNVPSGDVRVALDSRTFLAGDFNRDTVRDLRDVRSLARAFAATDAYLTDTTVPTPANPYGGGAQAGNPLTTSNWTTNGVLNTTALGTVGVGTSNGRAALLAISDLNGDGNVVVVDGSGNDLTLAPDYSNAAAFRNALGSGAGNNADRVVPISRDDVKFFLYGAAVDTSPSALTYDGTTTLSAIYNNATLLNGRAAGDTPANRRELGVRYGILKKNAAVATYNAELDALVGVGFTQAQADALKFEVKDVNGDGSVSTKDLLVVGRLAQANGGTGSRMWSLDDQLGPAAQLNAYVAGPEGARQINLIDAELTDDAKVTWADARQLGQFKGDFGGGVDGLGGFNAPDFTFDGFDIDAMLFALNNEAGYLAVNPGMVAADLITLGDFGGGPDTGGGFNSPDGAFDGFDIDAFLLALNDPSGYNALQGAPRPGPAGAIPEPAALGLLAPAALLLGRRRR